VLFDQNDWVSAMVFCLRDVFKDKRYVIIGTGVHLIRFERRGRAIRFLTQRCFQFVFRQRMRGGSFCGGFGFMIRIHFF
jgi:hypothetical protein